MDGISWVSMIGALAVSLLALAYVVWPIVRSGPAPVVVEENRLAEMMARKDAVLASIKDLEFDYRVGKMSEEDFQRFDQRLRRQAIGLIQQIEKLAPESASAEDRIEAEIARLRKTRDRTPVAVAEPAPAGVPAAGVTKQVAATPAVSQRTVAAPVTHSEEPPQRFCTNCGKPVEPGHKFCAHCGTPLATQVLITNN